MAVYGGKDRDFEMFFLNPMNLYYVAQRNNRSQISGLWAVDVFWKPWKKWTVYGQWLIDDIIINNEPGQDDRAVHPDRYGWAFKVSGTDLGIPGTQYSITYHRFNNWTYMSYRTWENYVFYGKSMGYPQNSCENITAAFDYFGWNNWIVSARLGYAGTGNQDITAVFGGHREDPFPLPPVEYHGFAEISVRFIPSNRINGKLDLRYGNYTNYQHVSGEDKNGLSFLLTIEGNMYKNFMF